MIKLAPDVATLLRAHGIDGTGADIPDPGYSTARKTRFEADGRRYVLKRIPAQGDWIRDMLRETGCREVEFATSRLPDRLPSGVATPNVGAALDGEGWALLMHDLTGALLPPDGPLPDEQFDRLVRGMAAMHAVFWRASLHDAGVALLPTATWVGCLSPETGRRLIELAWFLAVNSSRLPRSLDDALDRYAAAVRSELGRRASELRWDEQLAVMAIAGLVMYG